MSEPFKTPFPMRVNGYELRLMTQAFSYQGLDIESALEIEKRNVGGATQYIIHGPKKVQKERE